MSSLYARATPSQAMVLRIVEGAIRNAAHAHPELNISPQHRRSIAKRAAGTLTAQWPAVLAASEPSDSGACHCLNGRRRPSLLGTAAGRGASEQRGRSPLAGLEAWLSQQMWHIKASGNTERAQAFIDVLRKAAELREARAARAPHPLPETEPVR